MAFRGIGKPAPRPSQRPGAVQARVTPRSQINPANFRPLFDPEDVKFIEIKKKEIQGPAPIPVIEDPLNYIPPDKRPDVVAKKTPGKHK